MLWAHLDYYTLNVAPAVAPSCFRSTMTAFNVSVAGTDISTSAAWKVSGDDVVQLKKVLNQVLNETFSKQLLATANQSVEHSGGVDRDFVAALLRRVKRLIQSGQ